MRFDVTILIRLCLKKYHYLIKKILIIYSYTHAPACMAIDSCYGIFFSLKNLKKNAPVIDALIFIIFFIKIVLITC